MNKINTQLPPTLSIEQLDDRRGDLARFIGVISEQRWLIAAVAAVALVLGCLYGLFAPPVYQSDAVVQVLAQQSGGLSGLVQLSALVQGSTIPTDTEIQLLQTRAVLVPVINKLRLDIRTEYGGIDGWPVIRSVLHPGESPASVSVFQVPPALEGFPFIVHLGRDGRFQLLGPNGKSVTNGWIGAPAVARIQTSTGPGIISLRVDRVAAGVTSFKLVKEPIDQAIKDVLMRLSAQEIGEQTGLIAVSMEGESSIRVAEQLNAIAEANLRQNIKQNSAQAAGELEFLKRQTPDLEVRLQDSQAKLATFLATRPTVAAFSQSAQYVVQEVGAVEEEMAPIEAQIAETRQVLGSENPKLLAMQAQLRALKGQHDQLLGNISKLPKDEQTFVRLQSDVTTNQTLYASMLNQIETLQIAQAGTVGDIVVVDRAIPTSKPVSPRLAIDVSLALFVGLFGGVAGAFARRSLRHGIDDPEALSDQFSLPVHAVLLHSREEDRLKRARKSGTSGLEGLLAARGKDVTTEGLRSLRTALQLALPSSSKRILTISSLSPEEGKSFVSSNVAYLFAQSGQRTLLIDADMRRGHLHRLLGLGRSTGLSEVLRGAIGLDKAIIRTVLPELDMLPSGPIPSDPTHLLMNADLDSLLQECAKRYSLVVVDLPPVLAASDALLLGRYATLNLLVLKHGKHGYRQIRFALRRFAQHRAAVHGLVINNVSSAAQRYAYREYGYQYDYSYK